MSITNITSETTLFAAQNDKRYGFTSEAGSIEIISGSASATNAANHILSSLNNARSVATEAGLAVGVAAATSLAALGEFSPIALGIAGMAGVASSISKGSKPKNTGDSFIKKGWTI